MSEIILKAIQKAFEVQSRIPFYLHWITSEDVKTPYICVGTVTTDSDPRKCVGEKTESIAISLHFWSTRLDRREDASDILAFLEKIAQGLHLENHSICLTSSSRQILIDTTTSTPYLHGVLFLDFLH